MGLQPHIFHDSLDWRFLLPMTDPRSIYVLLERDDEFRPALERAGIPVSNQLSVSDLEWGRSDPIQSLVLPFGLPLGWAGSKPAEQAAFYSACRRLIAPGGYFLVGFDNVWKRRNPSEASYHASTPRRIANQLTRAGFRSLQFFGIMPDLRIPQYIFNLDPQAIHFALQNRFRRKPAVLQALRALAGSIGLARISSFMPGYFAVATV
jgi:hypothetical protein